MQKTVQIDYIPRPWQANFEKNIGDRKRAFLLWARRHGKDIACWNYLITKALDKPGSYYYLYPQQNQARKAIWEAMTSTGKKFLDYIPKELLQAPPNNSEMLIKLINGSIIRILGSDNHDAFRSSNPMGIVFSEFAWHHPDTWPLIIEPILRENKGWALFNTTPFGKNHAFDLWTYAQKNPDIWYTEKVTNADSHLVSEEDFTEMRERGVSEDIIQGEYFCDFHRGVEGAYYAKIIAELRNKNKIRILDTDDYAQVHTAWDLGYGDSTSIWFYQLCQNEIHLIDYYENHGEGLAHYISVLDKKRNDNKWIYGNHYAPHDAGHGSVELGISRVTYARELGINLTVLVREAIDMGIERVRKILPRCYFHDKKCERGIFCLENYRKKYNEQLKVYSDSPLHDNTSHGADAFRYLCQAIETVQSGNKLSIDKYREMKKQAQPMYDRGFGTNSILGN